MAVGVAAEIKSKLNIVDVVGESVELHKAGLSYKGLCPFHGERTPSFIVTPSRESWHCFGCGKGGDVFSFVMERESLDFPEALRRLAARAGVELDEHTRKEDAHRARLREVLETAISFYHTLLTQHRTGQPALDYLRGRGFTDETIERFRLGWSPSGWDQMSRTLQERRQIRPDELFEVGLTTQRPGGRGAYDRFRARIIFPIRDTSGGAIGLGGRVLKTKEQLEAEKAGATDGSNGRSPAGDGGPKYLNTPATPLFDKSRTLYLVDKAKTSMRRQSQAVIVEGYTDALMAHQCGFDNVVASLGTALTPGQVALITRYAPRIALAYDVDPAGERAGTFGVTELSALIAELQGAAAAAQPGAAAPIALTEVGVVRLPEGKDPDEVIRDTPEIWRKAVEQPVPIVDYLIDQHATRVDIRTPDGRRRLVDAVLPTIRRIGDPVVRDAHLQRLAQRSSTEIGILREALKAPDRQGEARRETRFTADAVVAAREVTSPEEIVRAISAVEAELLRLLLLAPETQTGLVGRLKADELPSTLARELYRGIVAERLEDDGRFDRERFFGRLDDETRALAYALLARRDPDPSRLPADRLNYAIEKCLLTLEGERLEDAIAYTQAEQADAELRGDADAMRRLLDQERQYIEARRSLDRRAEQTRLLTRAHGGTR